MTWEPKRALVLGAGPVGLLAAGLLRLKGLEVDVVARSPLPNRKALIAANIGARYISAGNSPLPSLGGIYDFVIEATGSASVALEAQSLVGASGAVSYVGIYGSKVASEDAGKVFTDLVLGNKLLIGSVNANIRYFQKGVQDMVEFQNRWSRFLTDLITNRVPADRAMEVYGAKGKDEIKSIIMF